MKTFEKQISREIKGLCGFTMIELLAIIATVAILAALLLPTGVNAAAQSQGAKCLNNVRQLILAAQMYADDSVGLWMYNQPSGGSQEDWVAVEMDWGGALYKGGAECTNWQLLITPPASTVPCVSFSPGSYFTPYIQDPFPYRCPADPSNVGGVPRVRSYSANAAVGTIWCQSGLGANNSRIDGPVTGQWLSGDDDDAQTYGQRFQKTSQMTRPNPANLFIFCEEHPDSINDEELQVQIATTSLGGSWIDIPSNLHNGAGSFSFADGHAEIHKWVGRLMSTLTYVQAGDVGEINYEGANQPAADTAADLKDLNWVQARTSAPVNPTIRYPSP